MPNQKEKIENWRKRFDKKFSLSDFWLNPNNYSKNYRDIIAFIEKERKIVEDNTLKHIEEDYQEFIKEIRQEEKEKLLERIEKKIEYELMETEGFSRAKLLTIKIYLKKLKEEIKKEVND